MGKWEGEKNWLNWLYVHELPEVAPRLALPSGLSLSLIRSSTSPMCLISFRSLYATCVRGVLTLRATWGAHGTKAPFGLCPVYFSSSLSSHYSSSSFSSLPRTKMFRVCGRMSQATFLYKNNCWWDCCCGVRPSGALRSTDCRVGFLYRALSFIFSPYKRVFVGGLLATCLSCPFSCIACHCIPSTPPSSYVSQSSFCVFPFFPS